MSDSASPWTVAPQASLSMGFSGQEYWDELPFPSPGEPPSPGIEPGSPALWADSLLSEPPWPFPRQPGVGAWRKWGHQGWGLLLSSTLAPRGTCGAFTSTRVPAWISAFVPAWLGLRVGETPALAPESGLSDSQGRV